MAKGYVKKNQKNQSLIKSAYTNHSKDPTKGHVSPRRHKSVPSTKDYQKGYFMRYFVQRRAERNVIIEISKEQYDLVKNGENCINSDIWKKLEMKWNIRGRLYDEYKGSVRTYPGVHDSNKRMVEKKEKEMTGISKLISGYTEHASIEENPNPSSSITAINHGHRHTLIVDEQGNGWTSEYNNPHNPNIKHVHKVENWVVLESQDVCYPNCLLLYGYAGHAPHQHDLV